MREPSDAQYGVGARVEVVLIDQYRGLVRGREIRHDCPITEHESDRPASYNRVSLVWQCFACDVKGGVVWGDYPLAPLLGLGVDDLVSPPMAVSLEELRARRERVQIEAEASDERKAEALATYWRESRLGDELRRHDEVLAALESEGLPRFATEWFGFGYTLYKGMPALAIPWTVGEEIRGLQYRLLVDKPKGGRYRWHEGSAATVFNADAIINQHDGTLVWLEGAKKLVSAWGHGITSSCAIISKNAWKPEFAGPCRRFDRVVFALDPDAHKEAREAALTVPGARVARLPKKVDDLLAETGGDVDLVWSYIEQARLP